MPKKFPLPLILLLLLVSVLLGGELLPLTFKSFFLGISLSLKSILLFVLPAIIIVYLLSCVTSFEGNVLVFILLLLLGVCASNFFSTMIAYGLTHVGLPNIACGQFAQNAALYLLALDLPTLISNEWALLWA